MKRAGVLGAVVCLSTWATASSFALSGAASESMHEVAGSFVYFFPSQQYSGFYDQMMGAEFQYTLWATAPLGLSVVGGVMDADVRANNEQLVDPVIGKFSGSAGMIPIGISAL